MEQVLEGAEPAAVKQAQSAVTAAEAAYDTAQLKYQKAAANLENVKSLYELGAISQQEYDACLLETQAAQNAAQAAKAQVEAAQQQVVLISGGSNTVAVKKAQAAVEQVKLQIAQTEEMLEKYTIKAACDGTIISVNYTLGAMVGAGSDLAEVADAAQTYVLAYVDEEQLQSLFYGSKVTVEVGEKSYSGQIVFMDVEAVYTPREFQSSIQQNQKTFKIKAALENANDLKAGQEAKIYLSETE